MNELRKVLDKLGITLTVKDMPSIPAREGSVQIWRVTLIRTIGRGQNAEEIKLSTPFYGITQPLVDDVVACLIHDAMAGEQTLWDFAQSFCSGNADAVAEARHKNCKRIGKRARKFFGEQWDAVTRGEQGLAPVPAVSKTQRGERRRLKKSA
jgi:hypothetical protein